MLWTTVLEKALERRSNQSILKEINSEYSLGGLMLKLKLQFLGHLQGRADSLEKTLMLGKTEGWRRRGRQRQEGWMVSLSQWTWVWTRSGRWWKTGKPGMLQSMGSQGPRDWTTTQNKFNHYYSPYKKFTNSKTSQTSLGFPLLLKSSMKSSILYIQ